MSIRISGLGAPAPSSKIVEAAQRAQAERAAQERAEDARIAMKQAAAQAQARARAAGRPQPKPPIVGTTAAPAPTRKGPPLPSGKMAPPVAKARVILQPVPKPDDRTKPMDTPTGLIQRAGSGGVWPGLTDKKPIAPNRTVPRADGGGGMTAIRTQPLKKPVFPKAEPAVQAGGPTAEEGMTPPAATATDQTTWEGGSSAGSAGESGTLVDTTAGSDTLPMLTDGPKVVDAATTPDVTVKVGMSTEAKIVAGLGVLVAYWVFRRRPGQ